MKNEKYKIAIKRMGEFGQLFVSYDGCPRGPVGRMACPLEEEVLSMKKITDVDGGQWIPVCADALYELVNAYVDLREKDDTTRRAHRLKAFKSLLDGIVMENRWDEISRLKD